jgi:hypothetical protein
MGERGDCDCKLQSVGGGSNGQKSVQKQRGRREEGKKRSRASGEWVGGRSAVDEVTAPAAPRALPCLTPRRDWPGRGLKGSQGLPGPTGVHVSESSSRQDHPMREALEDFTEPTRFRRAVLLFGNSALQLPCPSLPPAVRRSSADGNRLVGVRVASDRPSVSEAKHLPSYHPQRDIKRSPPSRRVKSRTSSDPARAIASRVVMAHRAR